MTDVPSAGGSGSWAVRHRVFLGLAGAVLASGMAVLWWFVVPEKAETTSGWQAAAIRYGHPATWALLALLGVLIVVNAPDSSEASWARSVSRGMQPSCWR